MLNSWQAHQIQQRDTTLRELNNVASIYLRRILFQDLTSGRLCRTTDVLDLLASEMRSALQFLRQVRTEGAEQAPDRINVEFCTICANCPGDPPPSPIGDGNRPAELNCDNWSGEIEDLLEMVRLVQKHLFCRAISLEAPQRSASKVVALVGRALMAQRAYLRSRQPKRTPEIEVVYNSGGTCVDCGQPVESLDKDNL